MVKCMNNCHRRYHLFLFLSTFTRGLVDVFSLVLLYQKGFSVSDLFFFLFLMYTVGILVNYVSLKIETKSVLILSSVLYGGAFLCLSFMSNTYFFLILLAVLLASSNYSYHVMRHLLACQLLDQGHRKTNMIVTITYLGGIASSLLGMFLLDRLPLFVTGIVVFVCSILGILPVIKMKLPKKEGKNVSIFCVKLKKNKIWFQVLEQFKVIFLEVQPLFLYLYVKSSVSYVGIFNVIANVASLVVVYFLSKRLKESYYQYFCFGLGLVFLLKLNLNNGICLLILAFFEGIFVKIYENFSLGNLYNVDKFSLRSYLWLEELIFFGSKSFILGMVFLFQIPIYWVMYLCIFGIVMSGFFMNCRE